MSEKSRPGLYAMVGLTLFLTCDNSANINRNGRNLYEQRRSLIEMEWQMKKQQEPKVENVIAGPQVDKFFEIDGKKYFTEIDGRPIEIYFLEQSR